MKVAVLGYGTVGTGVYEMLRTADGLEPGPVLVRKGKACEPFMTTDIGAVLSDPEVGAVVEAMGGVEPAYSYAKEIPSSGRHFVTSNKVLVAAKGMELAALARSAGAAFLFSAACGGGVPLLHNLSVASGSDRILSVSGILNGTTNFMLHAMQSRGLDYAAALAEAQELGYAEADPTADVSGMDAARKILLACAVAFSRLPGEGVDCEGIESITAEDAADFMGRGLICRLIARGVPVGDTVAAYVEPVLFGDGAPERSVAYNSNMARYEGKNCGPMVFIGQGAGRYPTASAVLRDLSCILEGRREMMPEGCVSVRADNSRELHRYYVRTNGPIGDELPIQETLVSGPAVRAVTEPVSVRVMHDYAAAIRSEGGNIFYAALEV